MTSFFVSYNKADKAWAEWIAWTLEETGHTAIIQAWDFRPGGNFVLDMQRAAAETDKTIVVLSEDYLNAGFTQPEWAAAFADDPASQDRKLIPIRVRECQPRGLLRPIVYVDLVGVEEETASQAILNALPKRLKPTTKPLFPKTDDNTRKIKSKPEFPDTSTLKPWNVPYERNPFFTGREEVLQALHQQLNQDCAVALSQIQAISGLGGIGKTQTAVEYAYRYREDYDAVFWVRADTTLELSSGFVAIAQLLDLPQKDAPEQDEVVQAVKLWLTRHTNWLLIFDNADQPELLQPFKPRFEQTGGQGHLLITSRAQDFQDLGITCPVEMETLEPAEALAFLGRRSGRGELSAQPTSEENSEIQAAKQLAAELGYLPLALEQAAAYLVAKKARFQDYLGSYQKIRLQRLEKSKPKLGNYPNSVAKAWTLNFQEVEQTAPASANLLRVSALLHPDAIPFELLIQGGSQLGDALAEALADAVEDPLIVNEVLEPLCTYSLIRIDRVDQTYSIHRLVQEVARAAMEMENTRQFWINRVVLAANQLMPENEYASVEYQDGYQHWHILARMTPHTQVLAQLCHSSPCKSLEASRLFSNIGNYLREQGQYGVAEPLLQRACQLLKELIEGDYYDVATSLNRLAELYYDQMRYGEAEPLYQEALAMRKRLLGEAHPALAESLNDLAVLYKDQGRYSEAEPLYQEALAMRKRLLGDAHPHVAGSLNDLAILYENQGRYSEAEPLYQEALAMRKRLLGDAHPHVAGSLNNLAGLYSHQGHYTDAELLYQEALVLDKRLLGDAHPAVALTLNNLAVLYDKQGRYSEAEPLYQEALAMRRWLLGDAHPAVATDLNNLATLYSNQGRYSESKLLYQESILMFKQLFGDVHPHVAGSLNNLALLYQRQGSYGEAEPLYQESLVMFKRLLGDKHPHVGRCSDNLAMLYSAQDNQEKAKLLYTEALEILEQSLGTEHPWTIRCRENLDALLNKQGV
ncbi:MAG: FxSxx-COOH system tetratricopeptide repeat protein [Leptolyngbyaceae cyanobacterium MO_188.B28]|nr:FxSxx-COOH system tetratricopeptide repeat protein [Leptolyngbyaceae cyanobacterium MO_188.B28]